MKKSLFGVSLLTITSLYFLLSAIIILIAIIIDVPIIFGILLSAIILIIQFLVSPFLTDLSMKWFYKTKFNYEIPDYLKSFIQEVCNNNKMKYPKIGFIDDGAPNAFTYGHTKNDARIVITRGILELLSEEEVKSVVGHELGHAAHYDMLVMTVAQLVPLILYAIYESMMSTSNNSDNDNNSYAALIGMVAYVLYLISNYIILGLSRSREYYADTFSIEATRNPNALANALVKVGYGLSIADSKAKHSAAKSNALGIFDSKTSKAMVVTCSDGNNITKENIKDSMKWEQWNIWAKWYEFNSTHPLISKRLLAISNHCKEFNQEPYIIFDLEKPESYVDDFLIELLINFLPLFFGILGTIFIVFCICTEKVSLSIAIGVFLLLVSISSYIKFNRRYSMKGGEFSPTTVKGLLSEVKVSHITAIPCSLEGTIIGRGNPGCIFNEDFIIKDDTGIVFLDYNQPIHLVNKIFALFKSKEYFDKKVKITGWYRRSPVPYVELLTMEIDGKIKKIHTYGLNKFLYIIFFIISIALIVFGFMK